VRNELRAAWLYTLKTVAYLPASQHHQWVEKDAIVLNFPHTYPCWINLAPKATNSDELFISHTFIGASMEYKVDARTPLRK
jgi:hypothetical protein